MKAAIYTENSMDISKIVLSDIDIPALRPGYAIVKVHSASINPVDYKVFGGGKKGDWAMPLPFTPGYDISGVVHSIAADVSGFNVGDEVAAVNWGLAKHDDGDHTVGGAFAEYILIPVVKLSHKPANVSHDEAAALMLIGTTAYEALETVGVTKDTKILILGGSGAVGSLAIQLAKLRGSFVVTTASARSLPYVSQFGADRVIDYTKEQWWNQTDADLTGYNVVLDSVGEAGGFEHSKTVGLLKNGGKFISIANGEAGSDPTAHQSQFSYAARIVFSHNTAYQNELLQLLSEGKLKVVVEEVFPFTQEGVTGIFEKIKGGKSLGKNVLRVL